MVRKKRLLVAYDGFGANEKVPGAVTHVARHLGACVVLFHAVPRVPMTLWRSRHVSAEELQRLLVEQRTHGLAELAKELHDVNTTTAVSVGDAHLEIVAAAVEHQCDLVVVLERPVGERRGFGTTTTKLLRKSPMPVWAARGSDDRYPLRITAAVDVASEEPQAHLLNDQILEAGLALARHPATKLCLLHVWSLWGEQLLTSIGREQQEQVDRLAVDEERICRRRIHDLIERHDTEGVDLQIELARGDASHTMPEVVERLGTDLLIMGTLSRTGLPGLFMGNTSERILNRVGCSVLAVKPQGFVSPLVAAAADAT